MFWYLLFAKQKWPKTSVCRKQTCFGVRFHSYGSRSFQEYESYPWPDMCLFFCNSNVCRKVTLEACWICGRGIYSLLTGDVYSYAIILQQVVLRTLPFRTADTAKNAVSAKELLLEVCALLMYCYFKLSLLKSLTFVTFMDERITLHVHGKRCR